MVNKYYYREVLALVEDYFKVLPKEEWSNDCIYWTTLILTLKEIGLSREYILEKMQDSSLFTQESFDTVWKLKAERRFNFSYLFFLLENLEKRKKFPVKFQQKYYNIYKIFLMSNATRNSILPFVHECCEIDWEYRTSNSNISGIYNKYKIYCKELQQPLISKEEFKEYLRKLHVGRIYLKSTENDFKVYPNEHKEPFWIIVPYWYLTSGWINLLKNVVTFSVKFNLI